MTRSEPPVKTAPGLSAVLPGIGKKPSLPFERGVGLSTIVRAAGDGDDLGDVALGEDVGLRRLGLVGVLGTLAERLELLCRSPCPASASGVSSAPFQVPPVLDGEVAALVPDEAGEGVPVLAGQVDALRRRPC